MVYEWAFHKIKGNLTENGARKYRTSFRSSTFAIEQMIKRYRTSSQNLFSDCLKRQLNISCPKERREVTSEFSSASDQGGI